MPVVQARRLTKVFRTYKKAPGLLGAVKGLFRRHYALTPAAVGVDFDIYPGELVGFLGPNGAGKTTTLKMLAGLLYPTSGHASVLGFNPWERPIEYRRQFALLLGQKNQLWWDLPARDSLELNSKIYGVSKQDFQGRLGELTAMLDVADKLDVMVRELSLGERMKMEIIGALLHRPKVLYLDEPTIGLDVVAQCKVREFLKSYNALHQTTILLTSHYMADIQALCRRVIIIDHGSILYDGPLSRILDQAADSKLLVIQYLRPDEITTVNWKALGELVDFSETEIRLRVPRDRLVAVCKQILETISVKDFSVEEIPLETIVADLFSHKARPSTPGSTLFASPSSAEASLPEVHSLLVPG